MQALAFPFVAGTQAFAPSLHASAPADQLPVRPKNDDPGRALHGQLSRVPILMNRDFTIGRTRRHVPGPAAGNGYRTNDESGVDFARMGG